MHVKKKKARLKENGIPPLKWSESLRWFHPSWQKLTEQMMKIYLTWTESKVLLFSFHRPDVAHHQLEPIAEEVLETPSPRENLIQHQRRAWKNWAYNCSQLFSEPAVRFWQRTITGEQEPLQMAFEQLYPSFSYKPMALDLAPQISGWQQKKKKQVFIHTKGWGYRGREVALCKT